MATILAMGDYLPTLQQIEATLMGEGYAVILKSSSEDLAYSVSEHAPDMIILSVNDATKEAYELCRYTRDLPGAATTPILLVTNNTLNAADSAYLLDAGADELIKRPFASKEFAARVRALLRRANKLGYPTSARLTLDTQLKIAYLNDRRVDLTPMEFDLLEYLCRNRTTYHTAPDLLQSLWNYPPEAGDTALVRNHIRNLRRKLEIDPDHPHVLVSQYGRGYTVRAVVQHS